MVGLLTPSGHQAEATGFFFDKFKRDKCDVPPTWAEIIRGKKRWVKAWDGAAYCDRETGLVWEAEPVGFGIAESWEEARDHCINRIVGADTGQKGWRLPAIPELASLVDTSSSTCPGVCLPDGHPFTVTFFGFYWSSSAVADPENVLVRAWEVALNTGEVVRLNQGNVNSAWCVRGAMQESAY